MNQRDLDRIIEMAWEDRTPFDAILLQFGINEGDVIKIMRNNLKSSSFKLWRKRVQGRKTKQKNLIHYPEVLHQGLNVKCKGKLQEIK